MADVPALGRDIDPLLVREDQPASKGDLPTVGREDAGDQVQHRGFARPVLPDKDERLTLSNRECDVEDEIPQSPDGMDGKHQTFLRVTNFTAAITANDITTRMIARLIAAPRSPCIVV